MLRESDPLFEHEKVRSRLLALDGMTTVVSKTQLLIYENIFYEVLFYRSLIS